MLIIALARSFISYTIRKIFERSYIPKSIPSVCSYHDIQTNSWTLFLSWIFDVIHQWICLNRVPQIIKSFFKIRICLLIIGWKPENIQTNSEPWILIKVQCVSYISMYLTCKLYKLVESIFQISESFFELTIYNFFKYLLNT